MRSPVGAGIGPRRVSCRGATGTGPHTTPFCMEDTVPTIGAPSSRKADRTTISLDKLTAQWRACKGDNPHSPRCKRCRRGAQSRGVTA